MLAILGAMREEIITLKERMAVEEYWAHKEFRAYKGRYGKRELLLAQTGTGKDNAMQATQAILDRYPVTAIASIGFAGALDDGLEVGDIVIYCKAYCKAEDSLTVADTCCCDTGLLLRASAAGKGCGFRLLHGSGISVLRPIVDPVKKQELGKMTSASAADMESYWIGKMAEGKSIPFVTIRAISDAVEKPLLPFDHLVDADGFQTRKAIVYFLGHPWKIANLFPVNRNASLARRKLTLFMDYYISREPVGVRE